MNKKNRNDYINLNKIPFFTDPYPDELFYSILARFHCRTGYKSYKQTYQFLFGTNSAVSIIDFPSRLDAISSRLPKTYDADWFIRETTLFPYYLPFIPGDRAQSIINAMKSNNGSGIYTATGVAAGGILRRKNRLRYCPVCVVQDVQKYGEPYWHRVHQAPGVFICPLHKVFLTDKCPECGKRFNLYGRQQLLNLATECSSGHQLSNIGQTIKTNSKLEQQLFTLSKDIEALIRTSPKIESPEKLVSLYKTMLQECDLATPQGRIRQQEFRESFISYFGQEYLNIVESPVENCESNWLASIVRSPRKIIHPLRHLLLIRFLFGTFDEFLLNLNLQKKYQPFGLGPWPCLNATAKHYHKKVITDCKIFRCSDTKRPVGTFSCSCGFVFSRRGPDSHPEDLYKIGTIKSFGAEWENELRKQIEIYKVSFREAARRMKVDTNTIIKYVKILGLIVNGSTLKPLKEKNEATDNNSSAKNKNNLREKYRQKIINVMSILNGSTRTEIKKNAYKEYTWLYRHDLKWLESILPAPLNRGSRNQNQTVPRVDWKQRDVEISIVVKKEAEKLRNYVVKPVRITLSKIGMQTSKLSLIQNNLHKLPITSKTLEEVTESVEEYQIIRLRWAANILKKNTELKAWRIIRKAALRPGYSYKVNQAITEEVTADENLFMYEN